MKNFVVGTSAILSKYSKNIALEELMKHKGLQHKNLYETIGLYPNNGIGFKIWRKNWPADCFYVVHDVEFKVI